MLWLKQNMTLNDLRTFAITALFDSLAALVKQIDRSFVEHQIRLGVRWRNIGAVLQHGNSFIRGKFQMNNRIRA